MNKSKIEENYEKRRKIAGVFGCGESSDPERAASVGILVAKKGLHLLTGAGGGAMAQASEAFYKSPDRKGLVIGIVRAHTVYEENFGGTQRDYSAGKENRINGWIEIPIYTHLRYSSKLLNSRNSINALTVDVAIALPGGAGTHSEVELTLEYGNPVIFYIGEQYINDKDVWYYRGVTAA